MTDFSYFSTTRPDSLATALDNVGTSVVLTDGSTFPDPALYGDQPYTVILGYGTDREEIVTVVEKPTITTLTVVRGQDGTPATAKNAGDAVVHGVSARDFRSIQTKIDETGGTITGDLEVQGDLTVGGSNNITPIGTITMYGGTTAPAGWHLCDGSAHGSAALQAVLGSANTPDLRDRFIVGAGSSYTKGATGGQASVTLTATQSGIPAHSHGGSSGAATASHTHVIDPPGTNTGNDSPDHNHDGTTGGMDRAQVHRHSVYQQFATTDGVVRIPGGTNSYVAITGYTPETNDTNTDHLHGFATGGAKARHQHNVDIAPFNSGSGGASHSHTVSVTANTAANAAASHENRPPFYALTFIIRKG